MPGFGLDAGDTNAIRMFNKAPISFSYECLPLLLL